MALVFYGASVFTALLCAAYVRKQIIRAEEMFNVWGDERDEG